MALPSGVSAGSAVIAVGERHVIRCGGVVLPQLNGACALVVVATEHHQDRGQKFPEKYRDGNAAGQLLGLCNFRTTNRGAGKLL